MFGSEKRDDLIEKEFDEESLKDRNHHGYLKRKLLMKDFFQRVDVEKPYFKPRPSFDAIMIADDIETTFKSGPIDRWLDKTVYERLKEITPSADDMTRLAKAVSDARIVLTNMKKNAGSIDACKIEEIIEVGSHTMETMIKGRLIADFVVILRTLPVKAGMSAMGNRIMEELQRLPTDSPYNISLLDGCIELTSIFDKKVGVRVMIATAKENLKKLNKTVHVRKRFINRHLSAIEHKNWFELNVAKSETVQLIMLFKDLQKRFQGLQYLPPWSVIVLCNYCRTVTPSGLALMLPMAFKRILCLMSSGCLMPYATGIPDPIEHNMPIHGHLTVFAQEAITRCAQNVLRLMNFENGFKFVFGYLDLPFDEPEKEMLQFDEAAYIPLKSVFGENKDFNIELTSDEEDNESEGETHEEDDWHVSQETMEPEHTGGAEASTAHFKTTIVESFNEDNNDDHQATSEIEEYEGDDEHDVDETNCDTNEEGDEADSYKDVVTIPEDLFNEVFPDYYSNDLYLKYDSNAPESVGLFNDKMKNDMEMYNADGSESESDLDDDKQQVLFDSMGDEYCPKFVPNRMSNVQSSKSNVQETVDNEKMFNSVANALKNFNMNKFELIKTGKGGGFKICFSTTKKTSQADTGRDEPSFPSIKNVKFVLDDELGEDRIPKDSKLHLEYPCLSDLSGRSGCNKETYRLHHGFHKFQRELTQSCVLEGEHSNRIRSVMNNSIRKRQEQQRIAKQLADQSKTKPTLIKLNKKYFDTYRSHLDKTNEAEDTNVEDDFNQSILKEISGEHYQYNPMNHERAAHLFDHFPPGSSCPPPMIDNSMMFPEQMIENAQSYNYRSMDPFQMVNQLEESNHPMSQFPPMAMPNESTFPSVNPLTMLPSMKYPPPPTFSPYSNLDLSSMCQPMEQFPLAKTGTPNNVQ